MPEKFARIRQIEGRGDFILIGSETQGCCKGPVTIVAEDDERMFSSHPSPDASLTFIVGCGLLRSLWLHDDRLKDGGCGVL